MLLASIMLAWLAINGAFLALFALGALNRRVRKDAERDERRRNYWDVMRRMPGA